MPKLWWTMWKERNAQIFESKFESVIISYKCISLLIFWCNIAIANDIKRC